MPVYKKVNKNFFKKWTPEMAYVLGFFAADGYLTFNKRGAYYWCIQITDKALLEKIKRAVQATHKISLRPKRQNESQLYRLQIGSKTMFYDLQKLGFTPWKTKNLVLPHVPRKYLPHFVRGYFDGDGNVWIGLIHKNRKKNTLALLTAFTSCSRSFLINLHARLKKVGLCGGSLVFYRTFCRLQYSIEDSLHLALFMYQSIPHGLYINRKKAIFDKFKRM